MEQAIEEAHGAAGEDGERNRPAARWHRGVMSLATSRLTITAVRRDDAFDREIDAAHQDDESGAHAEHERDRGGIEQAHEIAESEEIAR